MVCIVLNLSDPVWNQVYKDFAANNISIENLDLAGYKTKSTSENKLDFDYSKEVLFNFTSVQMIQ